MPDTGKLINFAMRGLQLLWTVLVMALVGNMVHDWNYGNSGVINYDLFVSILGLLSLFYLIPATFKEALAFHPLLPLILDAINTLFWFCGAVATAARLGAHSCSNGDYLESNYVTAGSSKRCHEGQAATTFLFFGFFAFLASTVLSGLATRGGANTRPGIRRGPAMSQV
ncbi:hypothetical protein B0A54_00434 [Friedmanniomyces endolithicus]|uniref:MARVEL domain-containing protein n=1 Tax=Friedmanniomyces endolithicus TaxID=329885 RepID=A0A4U0VMK7_9PEZI|nr:hypothetical protein LTS09_013229 [Friedmanniomyces endolithicus]TKA49765.1 hypothetical protein B0A54_00434 [Friedmanniomyces endolithicus]